MLPVPATTVGSIHQSTSTILNRSLLLLLDAHHSLMSGRLLYHPPLAAATLAPHQLPASTMTPFGAMDTQPSTDIFPNMLPPHHRSTLQLQLLRLLCRPLNLQVLHL
jgi:hypothetical protein